MGDQTAASGLPAFVDPEPTGGFADCDIDSDDVEIGGARSSYSPSCGSQVCPTVHNPHQNLSSPSFAQGETFGGASGSSSASSSDQWRTKFLPPARKNTLSKKYVDLSWEGPASRHRNTRKVQRRRSVKSKTLGLRKVVAPRYV